MASTGIWRMAEAKPSILIAEDDAEIRHLIRERLESAGYQTRLVRDGAEAMAALQGWRFAGLLLDINMPHVDGFGVLEAGPRVRGFPPVLVLTARHDSADVKRAISLGARDYLTKPFSEAQLLARVKRLVRAAPSGASEDLLV